MPAGSHCAQPGCGRGGTGASAPGIHALLWAVWARGLSSSSLADYLVSRAQAAVDTVSALEQGHAQYLASPAGECETPLSAKELDAPPPHPACHPADASALVAALARFSHLAADTIINGAATSHLAPTDPADRKWIPGPGRGEWVSGGSAPFMGLSLSPRSIGQLQGVRGAGAGAHTTAAGPAGGGQGTARPGARSPAGHPSAGPGECPVLGVGQTPGARLHHVGPLVRLNAPVSHPPRS